MVTGAAGHHGVHVTLNVDLERTTGPGHVTIPHQDMAGSIALVVQMAPSRVS